jgi:hypothetical protein
MNDPEALYDNGREIGKGACGCVRRCHYGDSGELVAEKRVGDLQTLRHTDLCNVLREVLILKHLRGQPSHRAPARHCRV